MYDISVKQNLLHHIMMLLPTTLAVVMTSVCARIVVVVHGPTNYPCQCLQCLVVVDMFSMDCWRGGTVGQFGPSRSRIGSMLLFNIFLRTSSKFVVTIIVGHQKNNVFVLTALHRGLRDGHQGPISAQKSAFFYATPI